MQGSFQQYMGNKGAFHPQSEKGRYTSDQANLSRQQIGDQNRLPVPITTLHHGQTRVGRQKKSPGRKVGPQIRNRDNNLQANSGIVHHQGLFDTDTEEGDRTTTLSEISKDDMRYQNADFPNTKSRYQSEYSPASSVHAYDGLDPTQSVIGSESEAEDEASQESGSGDDLPRELDPPGNLPPEILEELNRPDYARPAKDTGGVQHSGQAVHDPITTLPAQNTNLGLGYRVDNRGSGERCSLSIAKELPPNWEDGPKVTSGMKHSVRVNHLPHRGGSTDHHHYDPKILQRQKTNRSTPEINTAQESAPRTNVVIETNPQSQTSNPLEHVEPDMQGSPGVFDPSSLDDDILPDEVVDIVFPKGANVATGTSQLSTKRHMLELDYTPDELAIMTYNQFSSEPFDHDPKAPAPLLSLDADRASLAEKLTSLQQSKADKEHNQHLRSFFSSLTIDQYDECGELMIDQITTIMNKYRKARQRKREAARQFEEEVAGREQSISQCIDAVEQGLKRLKRAGEDVISGKGS